MIRERLLFGIVPSACYQRWNVERAIDPLDTGRKLDAHKTLRIRPGLPLNVLCTSNSRPVYRRRNKLPSKLFTVIFHCNVILANITGSISLRWLTMFQTSEPSFLHIFIKSEFSERRFFTSSTGLRWPAVLSRNIRALRISMAVLGTFMPQQCKHPNSAKQ